VIHEESCTERALTGPYEAIGLVAATLVLNKRKSPPGAAVDK